MEYMYVYLVWLCTYCEVNNIKCLACAGFLFCHLHRFVDENDTGNYLDIHDVMLRSAVDYAYIDEKINIWVIKTKLQFTNIEFLVLNQ